MSAIGRLFIILNLALAAAFLGWASMALAKGDEFRTKYEDEVSAHEATRTELEESVAGLRAEVAELERGREGLRAERDQEKDRADRNKSDLDEAKRKNDQLSADVAAIQETLGGYKESIDSLNESKDRLVEQLSEAERERNDAVAARDDAERTRRDAEDAARSAEMSIAQLEKDLTSTRRQAETLEARLGMIVAEYNIPLDDVMALPDVEAAVLTVDTTVPPGLVALNVGKNQNVQKGHVFQISDGRNYKGQVRVQTVLDNMCSALITDPVPGSTIQQGDRAVTRF